MSIDPWGELCVQNRLLVSLRAALDQTVPEELESRQLENLTLAAGAGVERLLGLRVFGSYGIGSQGLHGPCKQALAAAQLVAGPLGFWGAQRWRPLPELARAAARTREFAVAAWLYGFLPRHDYNRLWVYVFTIANWEPERQEFAPDQWRADLDRLAAERGLAWHQPWLAGVEELLRQQLTSPELAGLLASTEEL